MCGIFAYIGDKENAGDIILKGLKTLEYRGYDSWGIALENDEDKILITKEVGKIGKATLTKSKSHIGIGHTRWATHGGVTQVNAHPHTNKDKSIIVVHNGIVENFNVIKTQLEEAGYVFKSQTDSEVIPHLIDWVMKVKKVSEAEAVIEAFNQLIGMNAIVVFFPKTDSFYAVKNGSPLIYAKSAHEQFLASDGTALSPYVKEVFYLGDNELLCMSPDKTKLTTLSGSKKIITFTALPYTSEDTALGKYEHFMLKEISEQPKVLKNIIGSNGTDIQRLGKIIKHSYGSYFLGSGSAYLACVCGRYLLEKIGKQHVTTAIASEFPYIMGSLTDTCFVLALTQSGETIDVLSGLKAANEKGALLGAITNVLGSSVYRMVDIKVNLGAGPEQSVCATKTFTAKVAVLYLLAHELAGDYHNGEPALNKAILAIEKLLKHKDIIEKLANKLAKHEHIFILGRGVSYPIALESALKIKEVSYIHAEGFAAGELKHGVIALIEKGTPVIIYNPDDETYEDTISAAYEVKARGAYVIGVSSKPHSVFDTFIPIEVDDLAAILPYVVVAQLIGYYLALAKGLDPDKPRNLAKSVTVK